MPTRVSHPVFSALSESEAWDLLKSNHIGRIAFFNHGVVDIEPVNYVADDSWLFVRSGHGTKLEVFDHHPFVAMEVDEIQSNAEWRSVVAHGTVYLMSEEAVGVDRKVYDRAVHAIQAYMPQALTDNDPVPFRRNVYGIHVNSITGRRASPQKPRGVKPLAVSGEAGTRKRHGRQD